MDLQTDHAEASLASLSCWNPWRCTGRQAIGPCGWPVETRNHDRKEGRSSKCDEVCVPSGAGDERSLFFFFFPFSNSGVCFPSRWAVPYSWLVGWSLCSLLRCGGRSSCQKKCNSEQKSFLLVDTDVPLRRTRNAKRPRTGQDREWSGERKTLWLWSKGAGTHPLRQILLVTIDLQKLHERQPV